MLRENEIEELYHTLKVSTQLGPEFTIKLILQHIKTLNTNKIDFSESSIEYGESFNLNLIPNSKDNCRLYFEVLEDNVIDIQIGTGGEYLYFYAIKDRKSSLFLESSLDTLFKSYISEETIFCDDKLIGVNFIVKGKQDSSFRTSFGNCFFWQNKRSKIHLYDPWQR